MNSHLAPRISGFVRADLRNGTLLAAIRALNLKILNRKLLRPE
jgi:hypothetical protein